MTFNNSKITSNNSIKIGSDTAPLKVVEYINLRCPDSKAYEEEVAPYLDTYIQEGKVQRILKHFDKEVYGLEKGNLLNQYLNYETPNETYAVIQQLFKEQQDWGPARMAQIPHIAHAYGLTLQAANQKISKQILQEVEAVQVERIPTVFVGNRVFVETIDAKSFKKAIEELL